MTAFRPLLLGFVTTILLLGGFGLWSATANINGAIIAAGLVEVDRNRQIVQHPDGGVVIGISVRESQVVHKGDLLFQLDGRALHSELAVVEGRLSEAMAFRARLEAERDNLPMPIFPTELATLVHNKADMDSLTDGQSRLFLARRDSFLRQSEQLDKRSAQIAAQIDGVEAQRKAIALQLSLVRQELHDQRALLEKGLTQTGRVMALQRDEAQLIGDGAELAASRAQAEGRATEVALEKLRLAALRLEEANGQLRDLDQTELELVQRRRVLKDRISGLEVRAPVSGVVLGLQVTTLQAVIRPAEPLLYIVPQDRPLVIATQVSPSQIDEIYPGQSTRLVLSSYPRLGGRDLTGRITAISADALVDSQNHSRFFRIEIAPDGDWRDLTRNGGLLPGMQVEVYIQTGARTPLAYLVEPFADYFRRAFRES